MFKTGISQWFKIGDKPGFGTAGHLLQFQIIPIWPTNAMINTDTLDCVKQMYPSARDAI